MTGLTYMPHLKGNITILFTRKRKIISGKFKFKKSVHEPVQIEQ